MSQPRTGQQRHPSGSHPPNQEDLDAVDKALQILALDDRTYCEPLFSFVQARIQGLQEVLDILGRSGRWVPALSDEELDDLVIGLASTKAPAEVLEEIRTRYVYPRCITKGQKKAEEESKSEHWEKRAAEMTEYMVGRGPGRGSQTPVEMQYASPTYKHVPPMARQHHPMIQRDQRVAGIRNGTHLDEGGNDATEDGEDSAQPTDTGTCSPCEPFPSYEESSPGYAAQVWESAGACMGCHDNQQRQQRPLSSSATSIRVGEGHHTAAGEEQPPTNMAKRAAAGAPYRAIYVYARDIAGSSPHGPASQGTGIGSHHRQVVIPPPPTPTWSESTIDPQTHLSRGHSETLHVGSPNPLPSFFTGAVGNEPRIQPHTESQKVGRGPRKQPPAALQVTEGRKHTTPQNPAQKPSVQRTSRQQVQRPSAPRPSVPRSGAPRSEAPASSASKPSGPKSVETNPARRSVPRTGSSTTTVPRTNAQKNNLASKEAQKTSEQPKGVKMKAKWR